jgi:2-amino-4-hydroxy-6-hydroxymethyldihydropteridine diphosphokinase
LRVPFPVDCVIGLGANLGQCEKTFVWTLEQLADLGVITALSCLYANPAVGGPPQPDYLNAAVRLSTDLDADSLLTQLQRIELVAGRKREVPWGPRTLDLDLLWISDQVHDRPQLTVPHPRLLERAFALGPLVEVAPKATCPISRRSYHTYLELLDQSSLRLVATASGPPWKWSQKRSRSLPQPAFSSP